MNQTICDGCENEIARPAEALRVAVEVMPGLDQKLHFHDYNCAVIHFSREALHQIAGRRGE